jgi:hypothetical protein
MTKRAPKAQLETFIRKFTPAVAAQLRAVLKKMRGRLPGAIELVYDNYNALAIGFASGERVQDIVFSIAAFPRWVSLFFFAGTKLDDPKKLLKGSGSVARHIVLDTPARLDDPAVKKLMAQALKLAGKPIDKKWPGRIMIKSISAKQRPRRPAKLYPISRKNSATSQNLPNLRPISP